MAQYHCHDQVVKLQHEHFQLLVGADDAVWAAAGSAAVSAASLASASVSWSALQLLDGLQSLLQPAALQLPHLLSAQLMGLSGQCCQASAAQ